MPASGRSERLFRITELLGQRRTLRAYNLASSFGVSFDYADADERITSRTVRPLSIAFFSTIWFMATWCELRADFGSFRLDRIRSLILHDGRFPNEPGRRLEDYFDRQSRPLGSSQKSPDRLKLA